MNFVSKDKIIITMKIALCYDSISYKEEIARNFGKIGELNLALQITVSISLFFFSTKASLNI